MNSYHLDLGVDDIANELTSRLDRHRFKAVIEADIVSQSKGSAAHAQNIDSAFLETGKPPYARRVATTIFLHSLTQGVASGVDPADMFASLSSLLRKPLPCLLAA